MKFAKIFNVENDKEQVLVTMENNFAEEAPHGVVYATDVTDVVLVRMTFGFKTKKEQLHAFENVTQEQLEGWRDDVLKDLHETGLI